MRWLLMMVCCYGVVCSVSSAPADENEPYLKVNTRRTMYNVGEKKAIYCEGQNLDGNLEWYFPNGKKVPRKSTESKRIYVEQKPIPATGPTFLPLIIFSVALSDSGTYTCKAGELKATIDIFVGEKVVMNESEQNYMAEEGGSVNLSCQAKGTPVPEVQWYRDSVPIENNEKYKITYKEKTSTSILRISDLNHLDPGTYICKATQEKFSHFAEKACHLTVQHKPVIINFRETEVFAIQGEWKNITCQAIASPLPHFTWSKHSDNYDEPMMDEGEDYKIITTKDPVTSSVLMLHINNDTQDEQYKCTASNSRGRNNVIFHISLGNKPDPPTAVVAKATASNITFEVFCPNCIFETEGGLAPKPENLTVLDDGNKCAGRLGIPKECVYYANRSSRAVRELQPYSVNIIGYVFEVVQNIEGYAPYWVNATEYRFDISAANETMFTIDGLDKASKYHVRVATRNLAGLSEWFELPGLPETSDAAAALTNSLVLLVFASIASLSY